MKHENVIGLNSEEIKIAKQIIDALSLHMVKPPNQIDPYEIEDLVTQLWIEMESIRRKRITELRPINGSFIVRPRYVPELIIHLSDEEQTSHVHQWVLEQIETITADDSLDKVRKVDRIQQCWSTMEHRLQKRVVRIPKADATFIYRSEVFPASRS